MSRQAFKFIVLFLSTCLIAACAIMPSAQPPKLQMLQAEPASYQPHIPDPSATPLPPTKYTFPSTVKTSVLAEGNTDEIDQLKALLPDEFKVSQANAQAHVAEFKSKKANGKSQILIPENGSFNLVLESGSQYAIVDDNATDGQAKITIPAGSLESWVHLQGPWDANSALTAEDSLYYVKDSLNNKQGNVANADRWFKLGVRPLPVPTDWYSPDGNQLILKLKTTDVKDFQMVWKRVSGDAPYPPGINKIGPAGGFLELSGVAKLKIGKDALLQDTVVSLRQEQSVLFSATSNYTPLTAPVGIYPKGLRLKGDQLSSIVINYDINQIKTGHDPGGVKYLMKTNRSESSWASLARVIYTNPDSSFQLNYEDAAEVLWFADIVPSIYKTTLKSFQTSAVTPTVPCRPILYANRFKKAFTLCHPLIDDQERVMVDEVAEKAIEYFSPLQPSKPPVGAFHLRIENPISLTHKFEYLIEITFEAPLISTGIGTNSEPPGDALVYHDEDDESPPEEDIAAESKLKNSFRMYLDPSSITNTHSNNKNSVTIDRVQHESFHLFQAQHNPQFFSTAFRDFPTAWPLESSARFMGTKSFYHNFNDFYPYLKSNEQAKSKEALIYRLNTTDTGINLFNYASSLDEGIKNFFRHSFYDDIQEYNNPAGEESYVYVNIFALIDKYYGPAKIVDICRNHLQKFNLYTDNFREMQESVEHLLNTLSPQNPGDAYSTLVKNSILKNYGIGTESRDSVEKIEAANTKSNYDFLAPKPNGAPKLLSKYHVPREPFLDYLPRNPLINPEPHNFLSSLSSHVYEIKSSDLQCGQDVYIYLDYVSSNQHGTYETAAQALAKESRVLLMDDYDFKTSKPEIAKVVPEGSIFNPTGFDPLPDGIFRFEKYDDSITVGLSSESSGKKYIAKVKAPCLGLPFKIMVLMINPYLSEEPGTVVSTNFEYNIKIATNPIIDDAKLKDFAASDPNFRKKIIITGYGFNPNNTWVQFAPHSGEKPPLAKATVNNTGNVKIFQSNGTSYSLEIQELIATVPNGFKPEDGLYALSGEIRSQSLGEDKIKYACNRLPSDATWSLASESGCSQ